MQMNNTHKPNKSPSRRFGSIGGRPKTGEIRYTVATMPTPDNYSDWEDDPNEMDERQPSLPRRQKQVPMVINHIDLEKQEREAIRQ